MFLKVDNKWTLFLDRDGVINEKRENDYVKNWDEFKFTERALDAVSRLSSLFGYIIVVTNQRGVGKGIMSEFDLNSIHDQMIKAIIQSSGRIDKIYYCTDILDTSENRKPNIGMGKRAKLDFPKINFNKSVIAGDSISDMLFGKNLGMLRIMINSELNENKHSEHFDFSFQSLFGFSNFLIEGNQKSE
jgi:histidinol-phosphate phosphatase family protein